MARNMYQPLEVVTFDSDHIHCPVKNNTYFELVFVASGSGYRTVNGHQLSFHKNYFFLHLPYESNSIQLNEHSILHFIKFQRGLFERSQQIVDVFSQRDWFKRMEFILFSNREKEENLIVDPGDLTLIRGLVEILVKEASAQKLCFDQNVKAYLFILLNITARNILKRSSKGDMIPAVSTPEKDIVTYINYHIFDPRKISVANLSKTFAISPNYFSEYFKSRYGVPLKKYITEYKLRLVESRLKYTTFTLSEIAHEFQFTDTSHLNRIFKKYRGVYPCDYKACISSDVR